MARQQRVACLIGPDFEDSEFRVPYDALRKAGYQVDVIGARAGEHLSGKRGNEVVETEVGIDDASPSGYDALFIPGGASPDALRADARFVAFVRAFDQLQRPIATICHGPQLLLTAGVITPGRHLTAYKTVQGDLEKAGAHVDDVPVVRDRHLLTSRGPRDLPVFTRELLELLATADSMGRSSSSQAW